MDEGFREFARRVEAGGLPKMLDVVQIDGKWFQVIISGEVIKSLDSGVEERIDWNLYELVEKINLPVETVMRLKKGEFSEQQIQTIRWGSEDVQYPHLKKNVKVFGFFRKKTI